VSKELLMDYREQTSTGEAAQHLRLVGSNGRRIGVVDKYGAHARAVQFSECMAQTRHVDHARRSTERTGEHQIGSLNGLLVPWESSAGGKLQSSAAMLP